MYRNEAVLFNINKYRQFAQNSWMSFELGEGGKEIENQDGQESIVSSQETRFGSQLSPRIGGTGSYGVKCRMHVISISLPYFSFSNDHAVSPAFSLEKKARPQLISGDL